MKKLLTLLLTLLMIFTLVGCNSSQDTAVVEEPQTHEEIIETVEEPEIVGGYVDVEDGTLTDELKDIFNSALEGLMGASYEPVELVATQVVAGTNYKFKANGTKTTNPITKGTYFIYVNKDLQGNVSLLDIETIEEKQEEAPKQDVTQMSFWVVFYDQYGNELQREALKYGTVPEYKTWLPEGFDKWVYKKSQKDVGTLKAITGNTYYQAVCHEVYHSSSDPTPGPTPIDEDSYKLVSQRNWFTKFSSIVTDMTMAKITNITFTKNVPSGATKVDADLTAKLTGKVKGYYIEDDNKYKIYIVGDYIYGNEDCGAMFAQFENLSTIDFSNFNTSTVTKMNGMFNNCSNLTSLNVNNFDTSNVTVMNSMFAGCENLASLDLSSFNTTSVTSMQGMFNNCSNLTSLNVNNFDTSNVTVMNSMFAGCENLASLDLSRFNTSSVTNMYKMFAGCESLESLDLSSFTISEGTNTIGMLMNCSSLNTIKINSTDNELIWKGLFPTPPEGQGWYLSTAGNGEYKLMELQPE